MIDPRFYSLTDRGLTVGDLCSRLGLDRPGGTFDETLLIKPAPLASSSSGDVSFLGGKRHVPELDGAGASACFVTQALADKVGAKHIVPIICSAPKYYLARATDILVTEIETDRHIAATANIHPSVHVGSGVSIGENVRIGPNSVITNAVIGRDCSIGACTVIGGSGFGVAIGPDGHVLPVPHIGRVMIGNRVRIGSNSCIDRGQLGDTVIGDDCQIDNLVQIAHNCNLEKGVLLAGRVGLSGSCHIGAGVMMGGSAGLADHITIGAGARLAAFAGVMHDVPAGETWSGIPAMPIREHMKIVAQAKRGLKK